MTEQVGSTRKTYVSLVSFPLILFLPFVLKNLTTFRVQEEPVLIIEQDQGFEFCTLLYPSWRVLQSVHRYFID